MKPKVLPKRKSVYGLAKSHIKTAKSAFDSTTKKRVSSVIALAVILLAAGLVVAMVPFAIAEMSAGQEYSYASPVSQKVQSRVLGDSTHGQPVKLFSAANLKLQVSPHDFDSASGKWNYEISWSRLAGRSGSIYINGNSFVAEATSTGSSFTGYTLDPKTVYQVVFYSLSNGKGVRVANRPFMTLAAPEVVIGPDPDVEDTVGASAKATSTAISITPSDSHQQQLGDGGIDQRKSNDISRKDEKPLSTSTSPSNTHISPR